MKDTEPKVILVIACAIFLFLGIITAGLGPVLPELSGNTGATITAVGGVFTAIFLGALISQLVSGELTDRFGQKRVLIGSLVFLAVGTIGFTLCRSLWMMLAVTFLAGLGHGGVDLSTNVMVSRAFPHKNASYMNLLHFFFGLGAFIGPALISAALNADIAGTKVLWLASLATLMAAGFVMTFRTSAGSADDPAGNGTNGSIYRSLVLWLMGAMLLLYVGAENGIGGWATTYMTSTTDMNIESAALVSSGYWGALMIGRLATAAVANRFKQSQILAFNFVMSFVFGLVFAFTPGLKLPSIFGIVAIGFFSGAVYPTVMSWLTTTFTRGTGKAASVAAAMGSIGGMLIPPVQGYLLENVSPASSAWFVAACLLAMLLVLVGLIARMRSNPQI